jgi:hypothetical protein
VDVLGFSVQKSSSAVEPTGQKSSAVEPTGQKRPLTAKELSALEFRKKYDAYIDDNQTSEQKRLRKDREAIEFANRELNEMKKKRKF